MSILICVSILTMYHYSYILQIPRFEQYGSDTLVITTENEKVMQIDDTEQPTTPIVDKEPYYPYVTKEELARNASFIRFDYYKDVSYPYEKYELGKTFCNATSHKMLATTNIIQNRRFLKLDRRTSPSWASYDKAKRKRSNSPEFLKAPFNWWYAENVCLDNNTNILHIYTTNATHFQQINSTTKKLRIPHDVSDFRHVLRIQAHLGEIPDNLKTLENMYVIINRGWNNMYHHSEWIIQFIRYMLFGNSFPPMKTVVQFPDIDWINHHTHDFKGHYRYSRGYLNLTLDGFKKDLQGDDLTPTLFEGEEYQAQDGVVCAKQAIVVPIITDMIKCFLDKKEAYQIRMLAYKRYKAPLPLQPPKKLYLLHVDRATANRGIKNQDEITAILQNYPGVEYHRQVNQDKSFSEQVVSMFPVDIMFTVHGAGLTNIIFMLPGSGLIEVFPPLFREPYYMWVSRFGDLVYQRISETKIINKKEYRYIRSKLDYTNKVFYLPPHLVEEKMANVTVRVWEKKYSYVNCSIVWLRNTHIHNTPNAFESLFLHLDQNNSSL